uniref:Uncharacterized protein n=1 Tax=Rhizophora mucronata TaxID=61149 RepID=A0A2P2NMU8_RHIMU
MHNQYNKPIIKPIIKQCTLFSFFPHE